MSDYIGVGGVPAWELINRQREANRALQYQIEFRERQRQAVRESCTPENPREAFAIERLANVIKDIQDTYDTMQEWWADIAPSNRFIFGELDGFTKDVVAIDRLLDEVRQSVEDLRDRLIDLAEKVEDEQPSREESTGFKSLDDLIGEAYCGELTDEKRAAIELIRFLAKTLTDGDDR